MPLGCLPTQTWGEKMTFQMKDSAWAMAYCCFAIIMVAAFVSFGVDPMTLAAP